jgi:hypothetical protein
MAGSVEREILHLVNADPLRTPTFTLFPKPDYFFGATTKCTPADQQPCASNTLQSAARFAWDHGYYAPTIDITWVGFVGPGVANLGLDGPEADDGPAIHDPNGGGTVPEFSTKGTWVDLPDIRPTILWLAGLQDSYVNDGRVLSEILTDPNAAIAGSKYTDLAECYKQLNASVGEFGTNTLIANTAALKSDGAATGSSSRPRSGCPSCCPSGMRWRRSSRMGCSMRCSTTLPCRARRVCLLDAGRCWNGPRGLRGASSRFVSRAGPG